jgi:hypothetical protein
MNIRTPLISAAIGVVAVAFLAATPAPAALVAHWTFDDEDPNEATDIVGTADGKLPTGATYVSALTGGGFAIDLTDAIDLDRKSTPEANTLSQTANAAGLTMTAYVKLDNVTSNKVNFGYFSVNGDNAARFLFGIGDANGSIRAGGRSGTDSSSFQSFESVGGVLKVGETHFVAAVIDYANDTIRLHVDDQVFTAPAGSISFLETATPSTDSSNGEIAASNFDGVIDDVRLYNTALSESEVQAIPIPEPGSLGLVALGVSLLLVRGRRA